MLKRLVAGLMGHLPYKIVKNNAPAITAPPDQQLSDIRSDASFMEIYERCRGYTMTSVERMYALYQATRYVVANKIPGAFVECGVWKGGSAMLAALTLLRTGDSTRTLYLYDTFEGMTEPTARDVDLRGKPARGAWIEKQQDAGWACSPIEEVREALHLTGYPVERVVFVKGKVEDTIPETIAETIALLRLDTDWYESTFHELCHLFPVLARKGVLIIDDYGHWEGCRQAVDHYIEANRIHILLHRIDYTGRIGVKTVS